MQEVDDEALFALVVAVARLTEPKQRAAASTPEQAEGQRALELLFERHHGRAFHWCLAMLGDAESAADTVNDIFLDLVQRPRPKEPQQRFAVWLYGSMRNRCLNQLRKRRRDPSADDPFEQALAHAMSDDDPLFDTERAELDRAIQAACLEYLAPREQEIVHLRYALGMKVDGITSVLRLGNASGARAHLQTAEKKLRIALRGRFRPLEDRDRRDEQ